MVQIWQMEPDPCGDRRLPHHVFPPKTLTEDQLKQKFGILCYKVDMDDLIAMKKRLFYVKQERNCKREDTITISEEQTPDFLNKMDELYEPVCKKEDVVTLVITGAAYYDIERDEDEWIRVCVERGDMIVIPAGVTHRFTTTPQNNVVMRRFFAPVTVENDSKHYGVKDDTPEVLRLKKMLTTD